jgi:site-specific DNA recombinase
MRGRMARVQSGKPLPGPRAPYGLKWIPERSVYLEDLETAPVVRRIFSDVLDGKTLREIARALSDEGIPTPSGGVLWRHSGVADILAHPIYIGQVASMRWTRIKNSRGSTTMKLRPQDEHVGMPEGTAPALIDRATFHAVRSRLERNVTQAVRHAKDRGAALLRGGIARCGHCGNGMHVNLSGPGEAISTTAAGPGPVPTPSVRDHPSPSTPWTMPPGRR